MTGEALERSGEGPADTVVPDFTPGFTPDFIVIGAMKAATSTVCAYFEDHPETFMVPRAEPDFFSRDDNWAAGPAAYAAHFAGRTTERLAGEGSNSYASAALFPRAAERMARYCPDVRLIYMVRDPVERIVSAWIQNRRDMGDAIPASLDAALEARPEYYVDRSLYWAQLARYRAHFPDERIFVGFMEDLEADAPAFFARLCAFLGAEPAPEIKRGHANPSSAKRIPTPLYSRLGQVPGLRATARALVPERARAALVERFLSRSAAERPAFSPGVRARLVERLRPDAEALLDHCAKPRDFWRL